MPFLYLGLGLVAASILLVEISLTRVFAVMMWHHLTYMAVSVAMLGFGAAGSLLTARGDGGEADFETILTRLARGATAYGIALVICFLIATRVPIDSLALWSDKTNFLWLGVIYMLVVLPFLFGGLVVGIALTRFVANVNRLYFADLLGSAIGGAASVALLGILGATSTVIAAAALGLAGACCFAMAGDRRWLRVSVPATVAVLALALSIGGVGGLPQIDWPIRFAPGKEFARHKAGTEVTRIASPTAEVEVGPSSRKLPGIGGNFGEVDRRWVTAREVGQDGTAPTMLFENAAQLERFPFLDDSQAGTAYVAREAIGAADPDVLVIGVGGGIDVMIALHHDAKHVTAVEFNPAMIEMVTERFDDYVAGLFRPGAHPLSDRIRLVNGEGRAFVRRGDERYDVIQLSGVDSFTALSTGAYTLAESYLYSIEAIRDFYQALRPGGVINYSRFFMQAPKKPRETLRLVNIARSALEELGVENPSSHILVFLGTDWASTMIRRDPFTQVEVDALQAFADMQNFWGIVFDPLQPADGEPPASPRREPPGSEGLYTSFRYAQSLFDALLRGNAKERAAFEASYAYDVTPSTDDAPFFFNYYKYAGLFGSDDDAELLRDPSQPAEMQRLVRLLSTEIYHPDFPVGHMVLVASLVQIAFAAALLILLPLRSLGRRGFASPYRLRILGYFSALGMGFMFVEIVLMQKMVLFLGHPTYSIGVVLTSLLAFAGLGSLLAGRIETVHPTTLAKLLPAVIGVLALEWVAVQWLLPSVLSAPLGVRVACSILAVAPVGLALGMPFPLGLRVVDRLAPELLPWAWAINGFLSVMSSVLCILLAMAIGFSGVFALAALIYAGGILALGTASEPA